LSYTVTVAQAGSYNPVARAAPGPNGGSIQFAFDGQALGTLTVTGTGVWQSWKDVSGPSMTLGAGTHILRLSFSGSGGGLFNLNRVRFSSSEPVVLSSFTLINAATDRPVAGYDPIPQNAVIDLDALGLSSISLRFNSTGTVGSVRFGLDANSNHRVDNGAPFSLAGDSGGDYAPWAFTTGSHTVSATPYSKANASGKVGSRQSVTFTLMRAPVGSG
ncbi:MAG: carbohydrate-binding protein, partial [Bradyrhizobium sp.]|nr:carbohydrate-binding protein [Bradyrhizobium sp.]